MFSRWKKVAAIYTLTYSGNKGTYSDSGSVIFGNLVPITPDAAQIAQGAYDQGYEFTCQPEVTVETSSRLVIDGTTYMIQGKSLFDNNSIKFQRLILQDAKEV